MKIKNFSISLEYIFLIFFIAIFLWYGSGNLFGHAIKHDFPYGYFASDAFLHQSTAEGVKYQGNFKYHPYYRAGGYTDVIAFNPPLFNHLSALLSYSSGIETYDTMYFLVFVSLLFSLMIFYLIIRRYNKNIAILSLPVALLIFTNKFYAGILFGQWDFYSGILFFIASILCIMHINEKRVYLLLGVFLAAAFLAHPPEAIWALGFIIFYFISEFIFKRFNFNEFKETIKAGLISFLLSIYYLPIFVLMWIPTRTSSFGIMRLPTFEERGYPIVTVNDFGWLLWLVIAGVLISFFILRKKNDSSLKLSIYCLIAGFTAYLGFDKALQLRFLWPLLMMSLFGLTLYYLLKSVKQAKTIFSIIIAIILSFSITGLSYKKIDSPGIMDPYHWEQLMWIKDNTPKDSKIYYFYSDAYNQKSILYNGQRVSWIVVTDDFVKALNNKTIKSVYHSDLISDDTISNFAYRKSFFSFGYHFKEMDPSFINGPRNICSMDYYVFEIMPQASRMPALIQYNLAIREVMLKKGFIKEVFNNQITSILKNEKPGEPCV